MLEFHLVGYFSPEVSEELGRFVVQHGRYSDEKLDHLLGVISPHLVWFPAQWPETYSYTLSAALRNGLPVAASDLGAFPERLAGRPWSWIRPWGTQPAAWNDFFLAVRETLQAGAGTTVAVNSGQPVKPEFCYATEYLHTGPNRVPPPIVATSTSLTPYAYPSWHRHKPPSTIAKLLLRKFSSKAVYSVLLSRLRENARHA